MWGHIFGRQTNYAVKHDMVCILQVNRCLQYVNRHVCLFFAFYGETLVQLFSVDRMGAMSYLLASNKMQDCSFAQFFLPISNKNEPADQLIVLKSNKMLTSKSAGSLKVKMNTSLVSAGRVHLTVSASRHLEALLYHSHLMQLLKVIS